MGHWFLPFVIVRACMCSVMMLCSAFGQPRHCLPRARSGKRRQLLACWADQFTAALLCAILRSRDRCCGGERKSRTRYHINHLEPADASDATRTSCLIVCPSTIFEIPLPSIQCNRKDAAQVQVIEAPKDARGKSGGGHGRCEGGGFARGLDREIQCE